MTVAFALDAALALLALAVAGWIVVARDIFAAIVGFIAYGLLLALVWVRLEAVDVAMTEAAIGGGVTGLLLLGAAARLRGDGNVTTAERPGPARHCLIAALSLLVAAGLAAGMLALPEPAPTLAPEAMAGLPATGLGNPVTATLMAYRAIDTLLEKVVLLLALLGVWSLAPDRLWGGRPALRYPIDRDGVLAFLARLLIPVGIVVGVHVLWAGADAPGGAFQGGTVLAAMWILTMLAGLTVAPAVSGRRLRLALVAGAAVFLAVGLAGFLLAGAFLAYPLAYAKPLILFIEVPVTLSIAATLGMLAAGPPERLGER
jgi:multisubunit Na+/H+ antiporter MnhB subunit